MMGRWKKEGNPNNKLVEEPEGNKENRYPDTQDTQEQPERRNPASNQTEFYTDGTGYVQETLKKFQDNRNREFEKAQNK
jgi:hypothetical protein